MPDVNGCGGADAPGARRAENSTLLAEKDESGRWLISMPCGIRLLPAGDRRSESESGADVGPAFGDYLDDRYTHLYAGNLHRR